MDLAIRKLCTIGMMLLVGLTLSLGASEAWGADDPVAAADPAAAAPAPAAATPAPMKIDFGDTGFMLICSALVLLMTPGLGFFYAGMVRRKNVLATFQHSFIALALISVQWVLFGYSLAFSPTHLDGLGFVGNLDWAFLNNVGLEPHALASTIPHQLHMVYQLMFAIITPALISGAFAERMKFSAYVAFVLLWSTLVYDPVAHWVWGGGWIQTQLASLDFAGGLVVHVLSGVAALCAALVIGKRKGLGQMEMPPHNLTMTALGTTLLWFGWFGFNAGSALAANASAVAAFVNTNTATAAAVLSWCLVETLHKGKATVLGACSGAVAGLVAITPAAGFVTPMGSIAIGLAVSFFCYGAIILKGKLGYDDSLDVFGVHGVGGAFGALAVGLLAKAGLSFNNPAGLFYGGEFKVFLNQAISLAAAAAYSFIVTFLLLKAIDLVIGLRVVAEDEELGLDLSQHSERGYILGEGEIYGDQPPSHNSPFASVPLEEPALAKV